MLTENPSPRRLLRVGREGKLNWKAGQAATSCNANEDLNLFSISIFKQKG